MKKLLIVFLVLLALVAGLFLWKGGHHALFLADAIEEWLDADDADQSVTLQLQRPDFTAEDGTLVPRVEQLSLSADTFWTQYHDRPLFGITSQGVTAYTDGTNLFLDTGQAYALPELHSSARKLAVGLLLHGRVTKDADKYSIDMDTEELELHAVLAVDQTLNAATVTVVLPDETALSLSMQAKQPTAHAIPQPVLDAMVRSKMEPPMPITEPLEVLLPALQNLLPLHGELSLSVECGILNVSDTAILRVNAEGAQLERNGTTTALPIPDAFSGADPAALALLLLRSGSFTLDGSSAEIRVDLPPEATEALCTALIPRLVELNITLGESQALLCFQNSRLSSVTLTADGEVPFLLTTIPVSFQGALTIP